MAFLVEVLKPSIESAFAKTRGARMGFEVNGQRRELELDSREHGELIGVYKISIGGLERLLEVRKRLHTPSEVRLEVVDTTTSFPTTAGSFGAIVHPNNKVSIHTREVFKPYQRFGIATRVFDLLENHFFSKGVTHATSLVNRKSTLFFLLKRGYEAVGSPHIIQEVLEKPEEHAEDLQSWVALHKKNPRS